jgi:hypothetical protein
MSALSAARTLVDLARTESGERLTEAFDSGLRDGKFSESLAHRRIVALRSKGRFGIPRLLEAIEGAEVVRGGHSWLEREYLRLVAAAGLPAPLTPGTRDSASASTSSSCVVADAEPGEERRDARVAAPQEPARWLTARSATSRIILASSKSLGV